MKIKLINTALTAFIFSISFCANAQFLELLQTIKKNSTETKSEDLEKQNSPNQEVQHQQYIANTKPTTSTAETTNSEKSFEISGVDSEVPLTLSVFNLKGFHLNMSKLDVKKLIPNSKLEDVADIGGRRLFGYQCGVIVDQAPSACGFTYAGIEITAISVKFWGDRVLEVQYYFGPYRPNQYQANAKGMAIENLYLDMRSALDVKYRKESNNPDPNGGRGTRWKSGSERLITEFVDDRNFRSNSISLVDTAYNSKFQSANRIYREEKKKNEKMKNEKKLVNDM